MMTMRLVAAALAVAASVLFPAPGFAQDAGGGASQCTQTDFQKAVAQRESSGDATQVNSAGYMGLYQFGAPALQDLGYAAPGSSNGNIIWTGKNGITSTSQFLNNPNLQTQVFNDYTTMNTNTINRLGLNQYIGQTLPNGTTVTQSSLLFGCQFGCGKVQKYFSSGGQCNAASSDGNGVCVSQYLSLGSGYDVNGSGSTGSCGGGGSNSSNQNSQNNQNGQGGGSTDMTSQACEKTMPIIEGIDCGRFPAKIQGFCQQYKPYLMTRSKCEEAEQWAKEQVEASGGGGDQNPQDQKKDPPKEPKGSGGQGQDFSYQFEGTVNNGDDGLVEGGGDSQPISPQPSMAAGGGPGGAPNSEVPDQPASGGPTPVGKIRAGNWKEACKKQTKYDGASVWSYVLWCSQLKTDPPRRNSGNEPSVAGNLGYSGPGSTAGSSGSGVGSSDGTGGSSGVPSGSGTNSSGQANGQDTQNPAKSSNSTSKVSDNECVQKIQAAGVQFTFEGYNVARQNIGIGTCNVNVGLTVKKWATASQASPVVHINCSEAIVVNEWIKQLGVSSVAHAGSYSCRGMRGGPHSNPNKLSYHGYGDAFDVKAMDGHAFVGGNQGIEGRARQLACSLFDTVLTDKYYKGAYTHFHVEMNHAKGVCK
jgi:hypothetical protein